MSDLSAVEPRAFLPGYSWRKRCRACDTMKELSEFYPKRENRDGLMNICIGCHAIERRSYYDANRDALRTKQRVYWKANQDAIRAQQREHHAANREAINAKRRAEREANRDALNAKQRAYHNSDEFKIKRRAYRAANRELINAQKRARRAAECDAARRKERERRASDPQRRLTENIRRRIRDAFTAKGLRPDKARRRWEKLVGYTAQQLMEHLERQFTRRMSWKNFGKWHIDHIIPVSAFSFSSVDDLEFRSCWALSNLRPLWASRARTLVGRCWYE